MADSATLAFYQREAPSYAASAAQAPSRHLDPFLDRLAPQAYILELGCGGGRDAAHMAARGFRVDATDGTPAMAKKARERTGLDVRVMRFDELTSEAHYDAVWAHASLLHVPRAGLADIVRRIATALRPGGFHFANFKLGEGEGRDDLGRFYSFPHADWLVDMYRAEPRLSVAAFDRYEGGGFDGVARDWAAVTVRRV